MKSCQLWRDLLAVVKSDINCVTSQVIIYKLCTHTVCFNLVLSSYACIFGQAKSFSTVGSAACTCSLMSNFVMSQELSWFHFSCNRTIECQNKCFWGSLVIPFHAHLACWIEFMCCVLHFCCWAPISEALETELDHSVFAYTPSITEQNYVDNK